VDGENSLVGNDRFEKFDGETESDKLPQARPGEIRKSFDEGLGYVGASCLKIVSQQSAQCTSENVPVTSLYVKLRVVRLSP